MATMADLRRLEVIAYVAKYSWSNERNTEQHKQ